MDKYIGNKKAILPEIEQFMKMKDINDGIFIDAFSGTTNVAQFFKQKGFDIICNDANPMSYVLGKAYIENNEFPKYKEVLKEIDNKGYEYSEAEISEDIEYAKKRIEKDIIFEPNYYESINYGKKIRPLAMVLQFLNHLSVESMNEEEELIFDYYCESGKKSDYNSSRGFKGKRNYFTEKNAKLIGKIIYKLRQWNSQGLLSDNEKYILLAALIEEVTLNANVNGTFHDFNRSKIFPNALVPFHMKPITLNIASNNKTHNKVYLGDANLLSEKLNMSMTELERCTLYIDPPYNFRQYGAYYHFLNFIAEILEIENLNDYLNGIQFVRGQNMENNFISDYCYKSKFLDAMTELIDSIKCKNILISYYDENNHWNHGKDDISYEGREALKKLLQNTKGVQKVDEEPFIIKRQNYQSQSGRRKKMVDELLFYGAR